MGQRRSLATKEAPVTFLSHSFGVLRFTDYRRLWLGQTVSMLGSNMRNAAILWHVTLLAPSGSRALALGAVGLARVVPIAICSLFAGVLADAVDRRRLLVTVNLVLFVLATLLAIATHWGWIQIRGLYVLAALLAGASTFDNPARNSFFPMLVPREELPRAIALNSVAFQVAAVLGPLIGGICIASFDVAMAYAIDAASFLVLFALLVRMPADRAARTQRGQVSLSAAWDGIRFVFGNPLIRSSMLLDFAATFFASATSLLPIFAQDVLSVGAQGYGVLSAAMAAGSMAISVFSVAIVDGFERRGLALFWSVAVYGLCTIGFGLSRWFWLSWLTLFLSGAADMVSTLFRQIIRQMETPDELRGRMASVNLLFFIGGPQLGELEAGLIAQALGPAFSVVSGGVACIAAVCGLAARSPTLRGYRSGRVG